MLPDSTLRARPNRVATALVVAIAVVACGGAVAGSEHDASVDAGDASGDANVCVTLTTDGFDKSCAQTADCTPVGLGTLCSGGPSCTCGVGAVAASAKGAYDAYYQGVVATVKPQPIACPCPYFGSPRCFHGACIVCGGAGPACPDGG